MPDPVVVELTSAEAVVAAAGRLRAMGYTALEAYTPFAIPELEAPLRIRRTRLPWLVLAAGASGAAMAFVIMWWTNAHDYRIDVGGRPYDSIPSDIPIMFETCVLFAALTAFGAALLLSGLPRLHHRVFEIDGFERTSIDRFWIIVGDLRALGEPPSTEEIALLRAELAPLGATAVRAATAAGGGGVR
jgi:hypothetical protein